jgi:hypothetical protein
MIPASLVLNFSGSIYLPQPTHPLTRCNRDILNAFPFCSHSLQSRDIKARTGAEGVIFLCGTGLSQIPRERPVSSPVHARSDRAHLREIPQ